MAHLTFCGSLPFSYLDDEEKASELVAAVRGLDGVEAASFGDWEEQEIVGVEGELINFTVHVQVADDQPDLADEVVSRIESCEDVSGVEPDLN
jgi:hypothetical protein